uniref:Sushi domain-containing protein n=1 Tax=Lutzomyia longipalpis TaxID=7200 RepID=A0A1B0CTR1_LUTLO
MRHNVNGQYFDCEQPPPVEHASSTLSVDDAEDSVAARYTCDPGFELQGQPDLFCDLDTDEWQGQLPTCRPSCVHYGTIRMTKSTHWAMH